MKKEIAKIWAEALRSGKYKQGVGYLSANGKYCCLGVLCDLAEKEGIVSHKESRRTTDILALNYINADKQDSSIYYLPEAVKKWSGVKNEKGMFGLAEKARALADLNDLRTSFAKIANIIEKQVDNL